MENWIINGRTAIYERQFADGDAARLSGANGNDGIGREAHPVRADEVIE
jgi:hypothetical protein